jgi:putative oxidoreductase
MEFLPDVVLLVGRVLFALIFINSGIAHLTKLNAMTGYAQFKKVPSPKLAVIVTGLMLIIGGLYVALGIFADLGALLLAIFLIVSAFMMHNFWTIQDEQAKQAETINFFKNIALAGAALIIFALVSTGVEFGPEITKHPWHPRGCFALPVPSTRGNFPSYRVRSSYWFHSWLCRRRWFDGCSTNAHIHIWDVSGAGNDRIIDNCF